MFSLSGLMDNLGARCASVADNVYAWPAESIAVPCVVVGYPSSILHDAAMGDGDPTVEVPVWYVVGKSSDRAARDLLSVGIIAMKTGLDGADAIYDVRVTTTEIAELTVSGVTFLAAKAIAEVYT